MATLPAFNPSASVYKPSGPSRHIDYVIYEAAVTTDRVVYTVPSSRFLEGTQTLLKIEDNGTLDVLTVRLFGVKKHPDGDLEILIHSQDFTGTSNPDLPSTGITGFVGETLQIQDPWGKYDELLIDIDATGSTDVDYDIYGVVSNLGE